MDYSLSEKQIENLIAKYPNELLGEKLELIKQQYVLLNGRKPDLIFKDRFNRHLIVEIQKNVLDEEHMIRMIDYYGDYKSEHFNEIIRLLFVANIIPPERKEFIHRMGFEFLEIPKEKLFKYAQESQVIDKNTNHFQQSEISIQNSGNVSVPIERSIDSIIEGTPNLKGHLEKVKSSEIKTMLYNFISYFLDKNSCVYADNPTNGQVYFNKRNSYDDKYHRCFSMFVHKGTITIHFPKNNAVMNLIEDLLKECRFPIGNAKFEAHKISGGLRWTISFHSKSNFEILEKNGFFEKYFSSLNKLSNINKKISRKCYSLYKGVE